MTRVILWRHGQTDFNVEKRVQGHVDIPLNSVGVAQAEGAARVLASYSPTHIVASDLDRAVATGSALAGLVELEVSCDQRLRERCFGLWEGKTQFEIQQSWPVEYERWVGGIQPEGVGIEPANEVGVRFACAVNDFVDNYCGDDCVVVVVSHGGAIAKGLVHLLGLPDSFRGLKLLDNCAWAILDKAKSGDWVLAGYNLSARQELSKHLLDFMPK